MGMRRIKGAASLPGVGEEGGWMAGEKGRKCWRDGRYTSPSCAFATCGSSPGRSDTCKPGVLLQESPACTRDAGAVVSTRQGGNKRLRVLFSGSCAPILFAQLVPPSLEMTSNVYRARSFSLSRNHIFFRGIAIVWPSRGCFSYRD